MEELVELVWLKVRHESARMLDERLIAVVWTRLDQKHRQIRVGVGESTC